MTNRQRSHVLRLRTAFEEERDPVRNSILENNHQEFSIDSNDNLLENTNINLENNDELTNETQSDLNSEIEDVINEIQTLDINSRAEEINNDTQLLESNTRTEEINNEMLDISNNVSASDSVPIESEAVGPVLAEISENIPLVNPRETITQLIQFSTENIIPLDLIASSSTFWVTALTGTVAFYTEDLSLIINSNTVLSGISAAIESTDVMWYMHYGTLIVPGRLRSLMEMARRILNVRPPRGLFLPAEIVVGLRGPNRTTRNLIRVLVLNYDRYMTRAIISGVERNVMQRNTYTRVLTIMNISPIDIILFREREQIRDSIRRPSWIIRLITHWYLPRTPL